MLDGIGFLFNFILIVLIVVLLWEKYKPIRRGRELGRELKRELSDNFERLDALKKELASKKAPSSNLKNSVYKMLMLSDVSAVFSLEMVEDLAKLYSEFDAINTAILEYKDTQGKELPFKEEKINSLQEKILRFEDSLNVALRFKED